jgi:hypothetical protein
MAHTVYRGTDVTLPFGVRNSAGSLIDLSGYSSIKMVIGTTADAFVVVKTGTGLDGTGDYNATVTFTNDDTAWDVLTGSSYKYQLNLTDNLSNITIVEEDTLTVKNQIPQS